MFALRLPGRLYGAQQIAAPCLPSSPHCGHSPIAESRAALCVTSSVVNCERRRG